MDTPTRLIAGVAPAAEFRVVDALTGDEIIHVLEADTEARRVVRRVVEDGQLVRDGDRFAAVEEERAVRFEPIDQDNTGDLQVLDPGSANQGVDVPGIDLPVNDPGAEHA